MPVKRSDWPEFRSACCCMRISTQKRAPLCLVSYSEVLINGATQIAMSAFRKWNKIQGKKIVTPTFNSMYKNFQIMLHKDLQNKIKSVRCVCNLLYHISFFTCHSKWCHCSWISKCNKSKIILLLQVYSVLSLTQDGQLCVNGSKITSFRLVTSETVGYSHIPGHILTYASLHILLLPVECLLATQHQNISFSTVTALSPDNHCTETVKNWTVIS
jgi:hypothetical protein